MKNIAPEVNSYITQRPNRSFGGVGATQWIYYVYGKQAYGLKSRLLGQQRAN